MADTAIAPSAAVVLKIRLAFFVNLNPPSHKRGSLHIMQGL